MNRNCNDIPLEERIILTNVAITPTMRPVTVVVRSSVTGSIVTVVVRPCGGGNGDGSIGSAMEGAGIGSVNAKRSSCYDAACETQSRVTRRRKHSRGAKTTSDIQQANQALRDLSCVRSRGNGLHGLRVCASIAACFCSRVLRRPFGHHRRRSRAARVLSHV